MGSVHRSIVLQVLDRDERDNSNAAFLHTAQSECTLTDALNMKSSVQKDEIWNTVSLIRNHRNVHVNICSVSCGESREGNLKM